MTQNVKVSVLGDGGWGTALALLSARRGNPTLLWSAFPEYAKVLEEKRENEKFLPGVAIPKTVAISSNIEEAVRFGDMIILAVPSQFLRNVLFKIKGLNLNHKIFVSVAKGIETKTLARPTEVIESVLGRVRLAVLSGPSHAEEVARGLPTLVVAGSRDVQTARAVQAALHDPRFRIYIQNDVIGIELCGALKNVLAVGAGICDGLGFGANTKAAMLTRGLLEITQLGVKMGANPNTFFGLAGVGDLITTCFSEFGRNLRVGRELGEGKKLKEILGGMSMVAEGVETTRSAYLLTEKNHVTAAIIRELYKILFEEKDPKAALQDLMSREAHEEMKQY